MEILSSMNHSVIFTQIRPNFLYTQNGQKQSLNLKQALSKYITKLEIYKWNQSFGNST